MPVKHFKSKAAAKKAAAGHWGTHVQYVRKEKKGYALFQYRKKKGRKGKK